MEESCNGLPVLWCAYRELTCKIQRVQRTKRILCTLAFLPRYMFDEPSSYLDVKQRLKAAQAIRNLLAADT